jgi:hypothetical protein
LLICPFDDLYVINDVNTYAAFFMYDKQEFAKFVESSFYDLPDLSGEDPPRALIRGYHIREAAAIGADGMYDHPNNWYIHTIIPISPTGQLHPDCRVYHMANNYVNNPYTFSASVRFDEAICWGQTNFCHPGMALARKRQNLQAAANPAN